MKLYMAQIVSFNLLIQTHLGGNFSVPITVLRERERGGGEQGEEREVASISPLDHLTFFFFFAMNSAADNLMSSFQQL